MTGWKRGDRLWFLGMSEGDGEAIPKQLCTCTGIRFGGYINARLESGRDITLPRHMFRKVTIGQATP